MDRTLAEAIATELHKFSAPFNALTEISTGLESGTGEEMRRHLGKILLEVEDLWRPVIRKFPDLKPE